MASTSINSDNPGVLDKGNPTKSSWLARNHFWLRRLHSLSGVIPIGAFMVYHLYENATVFGGPAKYDPMSRDIRSMPFVLFAEIFLIGLPILYHMVYGFYIMAYSRPNVGSYSYARNQLYVFQRLTGLLGAIFIIWHVIQFRLGDFLQIPANYRTVQGELANPLMFAFYVVGILALSFHLANGLWAASFSWGLLVGERAQKIGTLVSVLIFLIIGGIGTFDAVVLFLDAGSKATTLLSTLSGLF